MLRIATLTPERFTSALMIALALRDQFSQDRLIAFAKGLHVDVAALLKTAEVRRVRGLHEINRVVRSAPHVRRALRETEPARAARLPLTAGPRAAASVSAWASGREGPRIHTEVSSWLKGVVERLSKGDVETAMARLAAQGRVHEIVDGRARMQAVADAYRAHPTGTLVVSPDNMSREGLNAVIRQDLQAAGRVARSNHQARVLVPRQDLTGGTGAGPVSMRLATSCATPVGVKRMASTPEHTRASRVSTCRRTWSR